MMMKRGQLLQQPQPQRQSTLYGAQQNKKSLNVMGGLEWEMRPGGMLVQKRTDSLESKTSSIPNPTIRIRVKYDSTYHEIVINCHANFEELRKMLAKPTGVHPQDQKLFYKDKERDSKCYLDLVGVNEGSKLVLVKDISSQEKRFLEFRRSATMEKAFNSVAQVATEIDKLSKQVIDMESVITKGRKVDEKVLLGLIESFMSHLIKLDGIIADGDVKLKRKMQVVRIQKYLELLDKLKAQNAASPRIQGNLLVYNYNHQKMIQQQQQHPQTQKAVQFQQMQKHHQQPQQKQRNFTGLVVGTTKWEKF